MGGRVRNCLTYGLGIFPRRAVGLISPSARQRIMGGARVAIYRKAFIMRFVLDD
ncbi:MAG: hypothetical protein MRZ50_03810 [Prevotella sp.]|nr:hypothetical protein [Prevotella sp.]